MTQIETHELRLTKTIRAPRAKVHEAWTNPKVLAQWFAPGPMTAEVRACDARVGGQYEISMRGEEDGKPTTHTCMGVFQAVSEDRIVMTFNWTEEPLPNETTMTVELNEIEGGTEVVLTHRGFPTQEAADMHTEGWTGCLAKLEGHFA